MRLLVKEDARPEQSILEGIPGTVFNVMTDMGNFVKAWRSDSQKDKNKEYFCHGLSLGTYECDGYSVFGQDVHKVLQDEYLLIATDLMAPDDVIVFRGVGGNIVHSCLLIAVAQSAVAPGVDWGACMVRTKWSFEPAKCWSLGQEMYGWRFSPGTAIPTTCGVYRKRWR